MAEPVNQVTITEFFAEQNKKLYLAWVAGQQGEKKIIIPDTDAFIKVSPVKGDAQHGKRQTRSFGKSLVGYLNLIHPHQIQVLGNIELQYLSNLREGSMQDLVMQLFEKKPACIIVSDGCTIPALIIDKSNEYHTPLFISSLSSTRLVDELHYYFINLFADRLTLHGVFMEIMAIGVLITGPAGIGKSELALELIARGHRLIADDAPLFSRIAPDIVNGTCPPMLQDFLEVRGLGVINVRELFGDSVIKKNKYLRLIVQLQHLDHKKNHAFDRLEGSYSSRDVLGLDTAEITLPVAPGRNLAVMVECAARNHILRVSGYDAAEVFSRRQKKFMDANA